MAGSLQLHSLPTGCALIFSPSCTLSDCPCRRNPARAARPHCQLGRVLAEEWQGACGVDRGNSCLCMHLEHDHMRGWQRCCTVSRLQALWSFRVQCSAVQRRWPAMPFNACRPPAKAQFTTPAGIGIAPLNPPIMPAAALSKQKARYHRLWGISCEH